MSDEIDDILFESIVSIAERNMVGEAINSKSGASYIDLDTLIIDRRKAIRKLDAHIKQYYIKREDVLEAIGECTSGRQGGRNGYQEIIYDRLIEKLNLGDK